MNGGAVRRAGSGSRQLRPPQRPCGAAQGRRIASQIRQVGLGQQRHDFSPRRRSGAGRQAANVSREEARLEMLESRDTKRGAVGPLPRVSRGDDLVDGATHTHRNTPSGGNAMPGDVARASRALAVGNAEQAASRSKAAGRGGEPVIRLDQSRMTMST